MYDSGLYGVSLQLCLLMASVPSIGCFGELGERNKVNGTNMRYRPRLFRASEIKHYDKHYS